MDTSIPKYFLDLSNDNYEDLMLIIESGYCQLITLYWFIKETNNNIKDISYIDGDEDYGLVEIRYHSSRDAKEAKKRMEDLCEDNDSYDIISIEKIRSKTILIKVLIKDMNKV